MVLFPASFAILALWLYAVLRLRSGPYLMTLAMLPFGMFAVVQLPALGDLSITAAVLFAALAAGLAAARTLTSPALSRVEVNFATIALALFAVYAVFSALVLPRLFQGSFLVVPIGRNATGIRIDPNFPSVVAPVGPSNSNLSQSFYILIGFGFFVAFCGWLRRNGAIAGERLLAVAATINIVLATLNLLELDTILSWFQTATYTLHDQQTMGGFRRAIGGFAEPAPFGAASAAFFAYFAQAWGYNYRWRDFLLAAFSAVFVILSYSSTGFAAFGIVVGVFALKAFIGILKKSRRRHSLIKIIGFSTGLAATIAVIGATPVLEILIDLLDRLFFSKLDSLSGVERSAWSAAGMNAFSSTWGLGAGAGSLRSNGMLPVFLGSVGLPGTLAFLLFLWLTIGRPAYQIAEPNLRRVYASAQLAALAQLTAMFLSMTVPDPTVFLMATCAIASIARERAMSASRRTIERELSEDAALQRGFFH
ncbi:MAG: hypothetical protein EA407_00805 [Rhodobacteraceae bacterium]|nr:MAG: hypothetical protein EA407_00805 [Paracoccaceae bacterium]